MNDAIIDPEIQRLIDEAVLLRRKLHCIPETALEEHKTRRVLLEELKDLPLELHKPYLGTDIVADLIPPVPWNETVILRADMDGLNITEEGQQEWRSTHDGKMHACGHDGHMAIMTGAVKLICQRRDRLTKRIRFVFQPGEEMACAGHLMAEAGAYEGGTESYALHGWPGIGVGKIRTKGGVFLAATDTFTHTFTGRGTHGALPEKGNNPLPGAARFIEGTLEIHREMNRRWGAVISPCIVSGGSSANIIPESCTIAGTTRYLDKDQGKAIVKEIDLLARTIANEGGYELHKEWDRLYYLPVINREDKAEWVLEKSRELFGFEEVMRAGKHDMVAEDFAFCLEKVPGCFFQLGLGEDWPSLHTPRFDFNDDAIGRGILLFTALAGGL